MGDYNATSRTIRGSSKSGPYRVQRRKALFEGGDATQVPPDFHAITVAMEDCRFKRGEVIAGGDQISSAYPIVLIDQTDFVIGQGTVQSENKEAGCVGGTRRSSPKSQTETRATRRPSCQMSML